MLPDLDASKVLGAWGANLTMFAASGGWSKLSTDPTALAQFGVAIITIIYIGYKIRNERRK